MTLAMSVLKWLLLAQCVLFLAACGSGGGGGGDSLPQLPPAPVAPVITSQPTSFTVVSGQPATFAVTATGTDPRRYQWKRGGIDIAGATASSYTLPATSPTDSGASFTVTVANIAGSIDSQPPAVLTVTPAPVAPVLSQAPSTVSVVAGSTATFQVVAGGTVPFTYQWIRDGVEVAGARLDSYSLVTALADNNALISVRVSNSAGSITSSAVPLRVSAQFVPVSIGLEPADAAIRVGDQAGFSVLLQGTGPFTLQWLRGGTEIVATLTGTSALQHLYVFAGPAALADNGALFSLRVTDVAGNVVTSRQARLTVLP